MNENPSTGASNSESDLAARPSAKSVFFKLFAAGVIGWLVGTVILFGLSWVLDHPVSVPAAMVWAISHSWMAFFFGLLVLAAYGLKTGGAIGRAASAYLLPVGLLAAISGICLLIYPDHSLRVDLLTYLPMVLLFYCMAALWLWARRGCADSDSFARAIIPSVLGGVVILGFVTVPVFGSDAFRYRNTFEMIISKTGMQDGKFVADGTLEIREPGDFEFIAPRYVWTVTNSGDSSMESGVITWGTAGAPKFDAPGVYPMQIVWSKALPIQTEIGKGYFDDSITIEVHHRGHGDKVIYTLNSPIGTGE